MDMGSQSQNKLRILRKYLDKWAARNRIGRGLVAYEVVEKAQELGLTDVLFSLGIDVSLSGDYEADSNQYRRKIWRWLGAYEETKPTPGFLFYIEPAIVAAMPNDIKTAYMLEVFAGAGVAISNIEHGESHSIIDTIKAVTKEAAEATNALVNLVDGIQAGELETAAKELKEARAAIDNALATVGKIEG